MQFASYRCLSSKSTPKHIENWTDFSVSTFPMISQLSVYGTQLLNPSSVISLDANLM
jgi:hypothetical protein